MSGVEEHVAFHVEEDFALKHNCGSLKKEMKKSAQDIVQCMRIATQMYVRFAKQIHVQVIISIRVYLGGARLVSIISYQVNLCTIFSKLRLERMANRYM